jgi:hypothetical protein
MNLKVDDLLAGLVNLIRLNRGRRSREDSVTLCSEGRASPLRFIGRILRRQAPVSRSCDNLLVLWDADPKTTFNSELVLFPLPRECSEEPILLLISLTEPSLSLFLLTTDFYMLHFCKKYYIVINNMQIVSIGRVSIWQCPTLLSDRNSLFRCWLTRKQSSMWLQRASRVYVFCAVQSNHTYVIEFIITHVL